MRINPIIEAIDKEASALPPHVQREVLDFIGYLRMKYEHQTNPCWLEQAWGIAPEFPDRLTQPPIDEIQGL